MLLLYAAQEAYYIQNSEIEKSSRYPANIGWLFGLLSFALITEIILGTEIRGGLEMIRKENPLVESDFLLYIIAFFCLFNIALLKPVPMPPKTPPNNAPPLMYATVCSDVANGL